jgi:hypothetical protein
MSQIKRKIWKFLPITKLFFLLPSNINWLLTTVNHFTSMNFQRYTNLTFPLDQTTLSTLVVMS